MKQIIYLVVDFWFTWNVFKKMYKIFQNLDKYHILDGVERGCCASYRRQYDITAIFKYDHRGNSCFRMFVDPRELVFSKVMGNHLDRHPSFHLFSNPHQIVCKKLNELDRS